MSALLEPRSLLGFEKGILPVFTESINREHTVSKLVEGREYETELF